MRFKWNSYGKVAIYIDNANLIHSPAKLGWKINLRALVETFKESQALYSVTLFDAMAEKQDLDNMLRKTGNGFNRQDYEKKTYFTKGDCDVDLTVSAIRKRKNYDTLFLLSGDRDYVALVEYLQECSKKVVIISTRGLVANELIQAADEYIPFNKLKDRWKLG